MATSDTGKPGKFFIFFLHVGCGPNGCPHSRPDKPGRGRHPRSRKVVPRAPGTYRNRTGQPCRPEELVDLAPELPTD